MKRALDVLEKEAGSLGMLTTIGEITIGCALGYLDFRYANEPWRPGHPKLEAWYAKVVKLPPLAETMPVGVRVRRRKREATQCRHARASNS